MREFLRRYGEHAKELGMQAPKDGDRAVSDVRTCQDRGEPAETFVTRNCDPETVPVPQVLAWTGGGSAHGSYGVVTLAIEGVSVRYVPERGSVKPGVAKAIAAIAAVECAIGELRGILRDV